MKPQGKNIRYKFREFHENCTKDTPLRVIYIPKFGKISVKLSVLESYTLLLHRWGWNLARRSGLKATPPC